MTNIKAIIVIEPDGTERELTKPPDYEEMKEIVGGWIETVRVLRADIADRNVYTWMIVDEEGLLKGKPVNDRATDIYLANVRRQFPDAENPALASEADFNEVLAARFPDITVIDARTPEQKAEPKIHGTAIWYRGWTCDELEAAGLV